MAEKNRNKDFIREPGMSFGAIILLILGILIIGGGLFWFFQTFGDQLALPRPGR